MANVRASAALDGQACPLAKPAQMPHVRNV